MPNFFGYLITDLFYCQIHEEHGWHPQFNQQNPNLPIMIRMSCLFTLLSIVPNAHAQPVATARAQIAQYYRLAMQYKGGNGVPMDYARAVGYFGQAAKLGDAQSAYALAYMHYKGLGCPQDYDSAAILFAQGAFNGRANSMYFYGLCWRNGYGVAKNGDSARYWLEKSAAHGYKQAAQELRSATAENSDDAAKALVRQIQNAALPNKAAPNVFRKTSNHLTAAQVVEGNYSGYLIQYDWSGQNVLASKKLQLSLSANGGAGLQGSWTEEGSDRVAIQASILYDSIVFRNTSYKRRDHYSPDSAIRYDFRNAALNLVQGGDTVFLGGSVDMFSPDRKEPSKPLFVALERITIQTVVNEISLKVSPSPFTSLLKVEFTLPKDTYVEVQLLGLNGTVAYRNTSGFLVAGHYLLPLQPGYISPGVYLVKLFYDGKNAVAKIIRGE